MAVKKTLIKTLKEKHLKYRILTAIILIIGFIYFPRNLEGRMGIKDISLNNISHINLFVENNFKKEILQKRNITDQNLIEEILEVFSDKYIMRKRFLRTERYKNLDRNKPSLTSVSIFLKDSINPIVIDIMIDPRAVKIIPSSIEVNSTRYLLYGDGIDVMKLYDYARLEN